MVLNSVYVTGQGQHCAGYKDPFDASLIEPHPSYLTAFVYPLSLSSWELGYHTKAPALPSLPSSCSFCWEAFPGAHTHLDHPSCNLVTSSSPQLSVIALSQYLRKFRTKIYEIRCSCPTLHPKEISPGHWKDSSHMPPLVKLLCTPARIAHGTTTTKLVTAST